MSYFRLIDDQLDTDIKVGWAKSFPCSFKLSSPAPVLDLIEILTSMFYRNPRWWRTIRQQRRRHPPRNPNQKKSPKLPRPETRREEKCLKNENGWWSKTRPGTRRMRKEAIIWFWLCRGLSSIIQKMWHGTLHQETHRVSIFNNKKYFCSDISIQCINFTA